jgi:hypothetical protein
MTVVKTPRTPCPVVVVIDPTAIVIRRPTPRFVADPRPAVGINPAPAAITIRGPVVIVVNYSGVRTPNPTVVLRVDPIAVRIKILGAPNVVVVILGVVAKSLCQETFALGNPEVKRISGIGCHEVPVARIRTFKDEFGGPAVTQEKARGF